MNEQTPAYAFYKRLLRLYPREFRERLEESMEQTFIDLVQQRRQTNQELLVFVLWTFAETTGGILQEYISFLKQGDTMQTLLTNLRLPALVSVVLILPLMIMEVVNRQDLSEGFPVLLFIVMWFLPFLFILVLTPIVRNLRAGNNLLASPAKLFLHVTLLVLLVLLWTHALIDQMPCFLGVPNCD